MKDCYYVRYIITTCLQWARTVTIYLPDCFLSGVSYSLYGSSPSLGHFANPAICPVHRLPKVGLPPHCGSPLYPLASVAAGFSFSSCLLIFALAAFPKLMVPALENVVKSSPLSLRHRWRENISRLHPRYSPTPAQDVAACICTRRQP